jgi:peptidoglycan/xylan/chitin deacetylase (PgdA/CDA1 family)
LKRANVPATIFVSTGAMLKQREFWWDQLERVLLTPGELPRRLRVRMQDVELEWDLENDAAWSATDCARWAAWSVDSGSAPTPRHRVYLDLCRLLRSVTETTRARALDDLWASAAISRDARPTHRALSPAEITSFASHPGIEIGSHTACHSSLAPLDVEEQCRTISEASETLSAILAKPVTALAYPFGGDADVSSQTIDIARRAGHALACTTRADTVRRDTDRLAIPRLIIRDWTRAEFYDRWESWS